MSNYHILQNHEKDHEITVAFHFDVPNVNNASGVNYRTAVKQASSPSTQVPWLGATESTSIANGEILEVVRTIGVTATLSNAQKLAAIDAIWTENADLGNANGMLALARDRLKYWGLDRDVA